MKVKPQTDPPSEEFEPLVKLRGKSLDQGLRRANMAAWLMPDSSALEDEESEETLPTTGRLRGKTTKRWRWLRFFS